MSRSGFTVVELIVVMGIVFILFGAVLVALNPPRRFAQARDTKRLSDVNTILNAINQYAADNKGDLPTGITTSSLVIRKTTGADICAALVPKYTASLPVDPQTNGGTPITDCASNYTTNYTVIKNDYNRVTVSATPEVETSISAMR